MEINDITVILDNFYCFGEVGEIIIRNKKDFCKSLNDLQFQALYSKIELFDKKLVCTLKNEVDVDTYTWEDASNHANLLVNFFKKEYGRISLDNLSYFSSFLLEELEYGTKEYNACIKVFLQKVVEKL